MNDEQKTKLKWTFLLEKLRFGIQVFLPFVFFSLRRFLFSIQIKTNSNYIKPIIRIACLFPREYSPLSINDE